ncbi:TNF receptor-associated factor 4-like [Pocillopora verrucosa]|uniref:TNF receptor-associated factor 4-like n=1 Tax=Pocillopora verrucosa TaxID=203993 RepID=UPI0033424A3F
MAAGHNIPELGGYDFEFTRVVPDDFECPVCQLTMKDPIQIGGCGHRLCNICLESLLRRHSPKCPVDRQPLSRDKIFPDVACHRRILDLEVKCSYVGCPWTGELRAVQKHQSECLFNAVECPNEGCKEKLTMRDMNNHMTTECVWREVSCEYCRGSFIVKNKQQHHNVCQMFPVQCANNCGLSNIPREKLLAHIRDHCPFTEIDCKYKNLGCQNAFPRKRTKSHLESHMESHLNLALCSLEITQNQVKEQSKQIERLVAKNTEQSQQIERLVAKNTEQSQQLHNQSQQLNDQSQQIERLVAKNTEQSQQIAILEPLRSQPQYQAAMVDPTATKQTKDQTNKIGATNAYVKEGDTMKQGFKPKSIHYIEVGMKVLFYQRLVRKLRGTVKYVGPGLTNFIGVELDPWEEVPIWLGHRESNGTYEGKRYFSCAPGRGLFIEFCDVIECYR